MKKLLILLLFPLFFACSSDDDKEPAIEYIDNSVIEGKWVWLDGAHTDYLIFNNDTFVNETIHTYNGTLLDRRDYGEYKLSKDRLYYMNGHVGYDIKDNVLTLHYDNQDASYTKVIE